MQKPVTRKMTSTEARTAQEGKHGEIITHVVAHKKQVCCFKSQHVGKGIVHLLGGRHGERGRLVESEPLVGWC